MSSEAAVPDLYFSSSGETVTAVAMDYGYSSSGVFSSMFRRVTGAAPTDYLALNDSALETLSREC